MKRAIVLLAGALVLTACGNQSDSSDQDKKASQDQATSKAGSGRFDSKADKRSYALGMDIGNSLKELPVKVSLEQLTDGIRDVLKDNKTRLSQDELEKVMQGVVADMESAQQEEEKRQSESNRKAGEKFLKENKDKEGVKTLKDGLQYKVLEEGDGPSPDESDSVTVEYTGRLIDGTVFDSSEQNGKPVTFPVDAVIPGWTEALQIMKEGGEYELFIPPNLAYGERGAGSQIGPNETLIFKVKLLKVHDKDDEQSDDDE